MALGAVPQALVKPYVGGEGYTNVGFGKLVNFGGTVSAVDATTNQIAWQNDYQSNNFCYGGTTSTAGGLRKTSPLGSAERAASSRTPGSRHSTAASAIRASSLARCMPRQT